jgi:S-formylglutathione hydrolase
MQLSISYDLGIGAGFYVDATQEPYSKNYKMYTYITEGDYS